MSLKDIIIASLSRDPESMNFARIALKYLQKRYKIIAPKVEHSIYPGKFKWPEYNPHALSDLEDKAVYLFAVPTDPANILHNVQPGEMKTRAEFSAVVAKEMKSKKVVLVAPNLYFSRADKGQFDITNHMPEDKKNSFKGKVNLAKAQARAFKINGIDQVVTMHVHSPEVIKSYQDVFEREDALISISPAPLYVHYLQNYSVIDMKENGKNLVLIGPDAGSASFVEEVYTYLQQIGYNNTSKIIFEKTRKKPNDPNKVILSNPSFSDNFNGLEGTTIVALDDMDDTGGTKAALYNTLLNDGVEICGSLEKPANVSNYATHAIFAGIDYEAAMERIANVNPIEVIYANTHPAIEKNMIFDLRKVTSVIRTANYFGEVIRCLEEGIPLNELFRTEGIIDMNKISKFVVPPYRREEHVHNLENN